MRTPQQAYNEAIQILIQRHQSADKTIVAHKESYRLGLHVAIEQLKLSFFGVFDEVALTQQEPKPAWDSPVPVPKEAGNCLLTPEQRASFIAAANAVPDVVRREEPELSPAGEAMRKFTKDVIDSGKRVTILDHDALLEARKAEAEREEPPAPGGACCANGYAEYGRHCPTCQEYGYEGHI